MNSPYGSLDNNGGYLAYYCLKPWGEQQTTLSDDSGEAGWSQEWVGNRLSYDDIAMGAGGTGAFVFDDSHFEGTQLGGYYNHPLGGQGLQSWHVAHPEPTFDCTPINSYSTNAPFQGAFDLQSLQQVPPFDACCSTTKADEASRHAVQGHVGTAEAVGLTTRPALSDVPRTLPLLLPNRAHRVGRGSVEHQPAHIKKPDLFAGLDGQQSTPKVSDSMLMALPDVEPKPQSPRSESDLYTARWTVGEGKDRRGWCGYCSTYWKLKDSAYWYHLHYCHGVLSGGDRMPEPRAMREGRGAGSWEVQCGTCERWVALASGDKGRTGYFRHVYKCLTPLKREGSRLKNNGSRKSAATS